MSLINMGAKLEMFIDGYCNRLQGYVAIGKPNNLNIPIHDVRLAFCGQRSSLILSSMLTMES